MSGEPSANTASDNAQTVSGRGRGSGSRGRGGRGASSGSRNVRDQHIGTILPDLFTRPADLDKRGTGGLPVNCSANFVKMTTPDGCRYYQYHVSFNPEVDSKPAREEILRAQMVHRLGEFYIFDGMILYLYNDQGVREFTEPAIHPVTGDPVQVSFRQTVIFGYNDPQAINIYNLLVRRAFKEVGYRQVGRNFFDPMRSAVVEQYGLEVWPGYETAVRLHEEELMLCVENRFKVLRLQTVLKMMEQEFRRQRGVMDAFKSAVEMELVDQTVITLYNNRLYKVTRIDWEKSPKDVFYHEGLKREMSYAEYYLTQYNKQVTDMNQPLLVSEGAPKQPGGDPQMTFLMPELCNLTGLTDTMRKDGRVMKHLSQYTRLAPNARRASTEEFLTRIKTNDVVGRMLDAWRITVGTSLVDVTARQLEPERLIGANGRIYEGQRAEWARHVKSAGNFRSRELVNWIVISPNVKQVIDLAKKFIDETAVLGRQMGMQVGFPMCEVVQSADVAAYSMAVKDAMNKTGGQPVHMIVVLLMDDSKTRYDSLKKMLTHDFPVPSQMVLVSTLAGKPQDRGENRNFSSICLKVLVQMNCKMGGAAWKVNIPLKETMIMGYDLYHDSTQRGKTVGACVSSIDADFTQWFSQSAPHKDPTELGNNLHGFVMNALQRYYEQDKKLPGRLFLYRDGCGDGQIPFVKDQEVRQVKDACAKMAKKLDLPNETKVCFIIVTKKVNMRVFRKQGSDLVNPEPGTVVDSVVTRPERYDFYLVPQFVTQGTVTPVCYNIIHDESELRPDQHQKLAFKLSHLYYNWQGTVRVPAPCQYAHKLAFLIAQSIHENADEKLRDRLFFL